MVKGVDPELPHQVPLSISPDSWIQLPCQVPSLGRSSCPTYRGRRFPAQPWKFHSHPIGWIMTQQRPESVTSQNRGRRTGRNARCGGEVDAITVDQLARQRFQVAGFNVENAGPAGSSVLVQTVLIGGRTEDPGGHPKEESSAPSKEKHRYCEYPEFGNDEQAQPCIAGHLV